MRTFVNRDNKRFLLAVSGILAAALFLTDGAVRLLCGAFSPLLPPLFLLTAGAVWMVCFRYFGRQDRLMEQAVSRIDAYLAGDLTARIECDEEGELYRLFHAVNSLAAVLNAHADRELREKEFLKNTISDISHQLKTPLAALNIYNGLIQDEAETLPSVKEFAALSEQELDRMETLVQNLLTMAKLEAGAVVLEKDRENVAEMMRDIDRAGAEENDLKRPGGMLPFLRPGLADRGHRQSGEKRAGSYRRGGYDPSGVEGAAECRADHGTGRRQRHPSGGPAPHFQAVLPQPFF